MWEVGHSALHFPTQYIQGEPFGTALLTISSPVWVWAVLLKEEKREAIQSLREWDWWSRFDHHEPYGKCAVLKMTSNDPKMIFLLYFWTFWLLLVCLRPTTLCVVTLHHLQSYVYWSRFLWWILPYSYYNSSDSPGKIQFTVCELNWKLIRFLELLESLHYTLMFHPNPKREWSPLFESRESRSYQIIESEINTQTQKMARARGYEVSDFKCVTF